MQSNKGFTLVELIVVMAILAVLASLVTVNVSGVAARGRVTRIQTDLKCWNQRVINFYIPKQNVSFG